MFSKESPIGIIDSGIGGFSVARKVQKLMPPIPESITPIGLSLVIMVLSFFPGSTAPDSMFIIT